MIFAVLPLQVLLIERPSGDKLAAWVTQTSQRVIRIYDSTLILIRFPFVEPD